MLVLQRRQLADDISVRQRQVAEAQNSLEKTLAGQHQLERELENTRQTLDAKRDDLGKVQGDFYAVGAEVAALEQRIKHVKEQRQAREDELVRLESLKGQMSTQTESEREGLHRLAEQTGEVQARIELLTGNAGKARETLDEARERLDQWRSEWDTFTRLAGEPEQQQKIQESRIDHLQRQRQDQNDRLHRLEQEKTALESGIDPSSLEALRDEVSAHQKVLDALRESVSGRDEEIRRHRADAEKLQHAVHDINAEVHRLESRRDSLMEIQSEALSSGDVEQIRQWLGRLGSDGDEGEQLAANLTIEDGWEQAVDSVLRDRASAWCVRDISAASGAEAPDVPVSVIETGTARDLVTSPDALVRKVHASELDLSSMIGHVRTASDLDSALALRSELSGSEMLVTPGGDLVGSNWMRLSRNRDTGEGVLARGAEIEDLREEILLVNDKLQASIRTREEATLQLGALEQQWQDARDELAHQTRDHAELQNRLGREEELFRQSRTRHQTVCGEIQSTLDSLKTIESDLSKAAEVLDKAGADAGGLALRRTELEQLRERYQAALDQAEQDHLAMNDDLHRAELESQRLTTESGALERSLTQLNERSADLGERLATLRASAPGDTDPQQTLENDLSVLLKKRDETDTLLSSARDEVAHREEEIRQLSRRRQDVENTVSEAREKLDAERLKEQELVVRHRTLEEKAAELRLNLDEVLESLPEEAGESQWKERLEGVVKRIDRIGPVNLVAIEEFNEQSERKEYVDRQYEDLTEALTTLEDAIKKIDRETRARFKDTYDKLNSGFQEFFPNLFGGGSATLELNDGDLLNAGVTVMARPPGKRNSTIHLLSGGEKALTAVALLFSLFRLNPAPFCLLDEVDAPLDDANVERYCRTLRSLSERSQLVVITHNKITMESADLLVGVTMAEAGVSRLVSVDLSKAVELAAV